MRLPKSIQRFQSGWSLAAVLLLGLGAALLPGDLRERDRAQVLSDHGVRVVAQQVEVLVKRGGKSGPQYANVRIHFMTPGGEVVTELAGVVETGAGGPLGWRVADEDSGYKAPLPVIYDPMEPRLAMSISDYEDYVGTPYYLADLACLALGGVSLGLAVRSARRWRDPEEGTEG